jgi:hypothetical protein
MHGQQNINFYPLLFKNIFKEGINKKTEEIGGQLGNRKFSKNVRLEKIHSVLQ